MKSIVIASAISIITSTPLHINTVFRCPVNTINEATALENISDLDVWSHGIGAGQDVDFYVQSVTQLRNVEKALNLETAIDCKTLIKDYSSVIKQRVSSSRAVPGDFFSDYQSYENIDAQLKAWASAYPGLTEYTASIGKSVENRTIPLLKISDKSSTGPKKAIFWNGGLHAREWISPATVMYLAQKLLKSTDGKVQQWLKEGEFYIVPLQNPDGYVYSTTTNRLWRKNRRNNGANFGVDLNRNFDDTHWGQYGTSSTPSSDTYKGPAPNSEPEVQAITNLIMKTPNRVAGIDFHAYSQLILRNWGWSLKSSKNEGILKVLGDGISNAIKAQSGAVYSSDKGASLYPASGCADDWMSYRAGIVGFTIELRDTGRYGFELPKEQIKPTGEEIWAAMMFFIDSVLYKDYPPNNNI